MNVMDIVHDTVVDGEGLRTTIYFSGCNHFCRGCHNPSSWNINHGKDMTLKEVLAEIESNPLTDVTFSGGDPFYQAREVAELAQKVKKMGKNIWCYTGYTFEELIQFDNIYYNTILENIDVLVDGRFDIEKRDLTLSFRGSSNQRIIDVKASLERNEVIQKA